MSPASVAPTTQNAVAASTSRLTSTERSSSLSVGGPGAAALEPEPLCALMMGGGKDSVQASYRCVKGCGVAALLPLPAWPFSMVKSSDCGPSMPRSQHLVLASAAEGPPEPSRLLS